MDATKVIGKKILAVHQHECVISEGDVRLELFGLTLDDGTVVDIWACETEDRDEHVVLADIRPKTWQARLMTQLHSVDWHTEERMLIEESRRLIGDAQRTLSRLEKRQGERS